MISIYSDDFAYLIGYFCADGSFYRDSNGYRFEFVDGSPYENELNCSFKQMSIIKSILSKFLGKELPKIRTRGHRFVLSLRSVEFANLFLQTFNFLPGDKSKIIDIPKIYKGTKYEKFFWIGFLDGDGSIARKSKRVALESMSKKAIDSFAEYLDKNEIYYSKYRSKRDNEESHVVLIRSVSFKDFAKKIGFNHPLKSKLLNEKMNGKEFYHRNKVNESLLNKSINYVNIFDESVFLENGIELLRKYGYVKYHRANVSICDVIKVMSDFGGDTKNINAQIGKYRFKKSKGSKRSVTLPSTYNLDLLKLGRFVRIRGGGISFSKSHIESYNEDYNHILELTKKIFDIEPKFTCKNEPLFCSGVLVDLFKSIIK